MTEYNNREQGAVWKKNKVEETDRDYGGQINMVCPHCEKDSDHWLNGWKQPEEGNKPVIKFRVNKKEIVKPVPMPTGPTQYNTPAEEENPF